MLQALKRVLVGSPMATAQARYERLAKIPALAIFCSDALSSVAYAPEEIRIFLMLAGGAYTVARENLGVLPGLIAGASLLVGYVLTVAVSVAAGVAAVTSAFPVLYPSRVWLGVLCVTFLSVVNLRGIRETG